MHQAEQCLEGLGMRPNAKQHNEMASSLIEFRVIEPETDLRHARAAALLDA